jgi:hypothetical protein
MPGPNVICSLQYRHASKVYLRRSAGNTLRARCRRRIKGQATDDQGAALGGVRICLAVPGAAPGNCAKSGFANKSGNYAFNRLAAGEYRVGVLRGSSLAAHKADPNHNLAWAPVSHSLRLPYRSRRTAGMDFGGTFNFSNYEAELQLAGGGFPELAAYALVNDYEFLRCLRSMQTLASMISSALGG